MIDEKQIDFFSKNGAIFLKGYFTDWIEVLKSGIEKLINNPSPRERSYTPKDGTAPFFKICVIGREFQNLRNLFSIQILVKLHPS